MLGPFAPKRHMPLHDLDTVRDTLTRIQADLKRVSGLACAPELIEKALAEIAASERRRLTRFPGTMLDARTYLRRRR